ncbi:hypothetical protein KVR01_001744 [Diaporthe batatas]|uniref:uncharacterized protein n=1 Tax=Diaporthe batatas TaxID=748121 RepID=UPI001D0500CC|nr:uncharacterized protein KVR01_001744 [Diaporthe batatas]KAG8168995.1 hypothetical protein KVR01_001744 [Diaporthe batatas]
MEISIVFAILVTAMTPACMAAAEGELRLRVTKPLARRASNGQSASSNVLTLRKGVKTAKSSSYLKNLRVASPSNHDRHNGDGLIPVDDILSAEYVTEIAWNGIPVNVLVDTGSSDSWLIQDGFTCVDQQNKTQPGTFNGGVISNQHFSLMYADLEFMTGAMGYETVIVAGITIEKQEVALVNYTYWFGDNVTSGLMGLAYPRLTSAYVGTNSSANDLDEQVPYNPIMTSMIKRGLIEPVFSLVLERDSDQGFLALGGLPTINQTGPFATTPIVMNI